MPDYQTMYFKLAAKIADTIVMLDKASRDLKFVQMWAEEMCISSEAEMEGDE